MNYETIPMQAYVFLDQLDNLRLNGEFKRGQLEMTQHGNLSMLIVTQASRKQIQRWFRQCGGHVISLKQEKGSPRWIAIFRCWEAEAVEL